MLRVLIVDDSALVRERLAAALAERGGIEMVGYAESVSAARRALHSLSVDVVVLDIRMPDGSGVELIRAIKATTPHVTVIMFTSYDDAHYRERCLRLGADLFFGKTAGLDRLVQAIYEGRGIETQAPSGPAPAALPPPRASL